MGTRNGGRTGTETTFFYGRTARVRKRHARRAACCEAVSNLINLKPVTACDVWQKLRAATSITYEEVRNAIEWLAEDGRVEEAEGVDRWVTSQVETSAFAEHISRTTSGALVATDASWCAGIGGGAVTWAAAGGKIRSDLVLLADVVDNNVAEAKTLRAGIKRAEASSGVIMTDSSYARREVSTMDVVTTGKVDIMLLRRNAHPVHAAADLGAKRGDGWRRVARQPSAKAGDDKDGSSTTLWLLYYPVAVVTKSESVRCLWSLLAHGM
eukprot:CAMPEP_0178997412 /NCGR_PEP_ID=MMETSP0795-20121207/8913_1 /TAXON_ID=88552 /ORGANISM="Amoebophrya sp., Strain Ameob2" /LENGTH=267 /DNA_ID=CAMNT_0020689917 /DNA_START=821 /DNA_END=1624 /DNA_ORIENTATION=-